MCKIEQELFSQAKQTNKKEIVFDLLDLLSRLFLDVPRE